MARVKEWTDEEVQKLRNLYSSNRTFEEITDEFPPRTSNAIRLKASRLGIRRPLLAGDVVQLKPLMFKSVDGNRGNGYLLKCKNCNSWIQMDEEQSKHSGIVSCSECGYVYQVLTEA